MDVFVVKNFLSCLCMFCEALHCVGDECVSEHISDLVEVFRHNVFCASQVKVCQLVGLVS